tara:strand:- start:367 stop:552 length:186 start_codon:yes stop_codon:yes gene_type:complete
MKIVIIMWILTLSNLKSEKIIYDGTLQDCLHEALSFNIKYEKKAYAGCYVDVKQYDFVPRK